MLTINLENQVALITGITSGIGAGVAQVLAQAGCDIAGCALEKKGNVKVETFIKSVEKKGKKALYVETDVTSDNALQNLVDLTFQTFGRIDIVVSNAGQNVFKGAGECTSEEWNFNINLNMKSHWMLSKLCMQYLVKSPNGVIIIMTSNHAFGSMPGCFPYNIAKTALRGLVNALAIEWGPDIRTIGLAPGFIDTEGGDRWFNSFPEPTKERERTIKLHPVAKLGTTEEIGGFCAFLASDYAKFITGTTYLIDGGRSALMQDRPG